MTVTTFLASDWYQSLMQLIPDGKLFSLRSVFDGIPRIVQQLPTTLMLTLGGAIFGLVLALIFAIVKINRVKILYPLQAFFVSFLKVCLTSQEWARSHPTLRKGVCRYCYP